jgi:hypothetical protein
MNVKRSNKKDCMEAMKRSLEPDESRPGIVDDKYSKRAMIRGNFVVFRIVRSNDIIFVLEDPRCEQLDLKPVTLDGIRGKFNGRIRIVGYVEGEIRSDAPIYRIDEECLGIRRVIGRQKET